MSSLRTIWILISVLVNYYCSADKHTSGYSSYDNLYFHKEVTHNRGDGLKNYTLLFNFLADGFKEVTYVEIDIPDAKSKGKIEVTDKNVTAKINIVNAKSFSAKIYVRGESNYPFGYMQAFRNLEHITVKSLTFVYVRKASSPAPKTNAQNSIGNRQDGDKLLHFESRNVTNFSRFPSRAFYYSGDEYLTYVGFSFNSPTALAMVNTSFVGEHEFNAVVYDMNTEHFTANMSVYGIVSDKKPDQFSDVCGL